MIAIACKNVSFEQVIDSCLRRVPGGSMPENCKSPVRTTVRAKICFSNELPEGCPPIELPKGRMMMEVELDDLTLLIIREGAMDRDLFDEWNRYLDRVTTLGIWSRDPSRTSIFKALLSATSG